MHRHRTIWALLGLLTGFVLLGGAGAGAGQTTPPAATEIAANKYLGPPKGRLRSRKRLMDPSLPSPDRPRGKLAFRWFWNEVSPRAGAGNAVRWQRVIRIIEKARGRGRPVYGSAAVARRILSQYRPMLEREAKKRNISLALLVAVIAVESNGNPRAISPAGAGGLMQLMPATARRFGVSNALAPAQNIRGGARYLDWLLRRFRNDAVLALAGYNAGEGAVDKYRGVPPFNETRDYVAKVAGAYAAARALCQNLPQGARETCVLRN